MKEGDKLIALCRLIELDELAKALEQKAKELRLEIWKLQENETK